MMLGSSRVLRVFAYPRAVDLRKVTVCPGPY